MDKGEEGEEEGGEVPVFSRANHFRSLGICETNTTFGTVSGSVDSETQGGDTDIPADRAILKTNNASFDSWTGKQDGIETSEHLVPNPRGGGDTEWDQFKSDFMQRLEDQGLEKVKEDQASPENRLPLEALSELLSNAVVNPDPIIPQVTNLHEDGGTQSNEREGEDRQGPAVADDTQTARITDNHSGTLSTDLLAEINMSALDRALELVDAEEVSRTSNESEANRHRQPKTAWEESEGSTPDLMSQLAELRNGIELQTKERRTMCKRQSSEPTLHGVLTETGRHNKPESEKKTVYIDLRQPAPRIDARQSQSQ